MIRDSTQEKNLDLYANRCFNVVKNWLKKYQEASSKRIARMAEIRQKFELLAKIKNHNLKNNNKSISSFYHDYSRLERSQSFKDIFARLALAEHSKNEGWMRAELDRLLRYDFTELYFDFTNTLDRQWLSDLENLYFHFFERWGKLDNSLLRQFIFLFSLGQEHEERYKNLRMNLDIAWSLADIRTFVKSVNYGQRYPGFWFRILNRRSSEMEVDYFLSTLHEENKIKAMGKNELWILLEKIPSQVSKKAVLVDRLIELWGSDTAYDKYIVLKFLEDKGIKAALESRNDLFKRPLFQLKKETFTEIYFKKEAELLMIFELIMLGDYQENYLDDLLWL